jgi:osmotically-inducible protein OsmY
MKTDLQIETIVTAELVWDPAVHATRAGVADREGSATPDEGHADAQKIRAEIAAALTRHAQREAGRIAIDVEGGVVTLHGQVDSLAERDAAMGTAFAAKGVTRVIDRLEVRG